MEAGTDYPAVRRGEGYAVGHLDDLGDGPGFRKVRHGLGVDAFGVNAIVIPPGSKRAFTTTTASRSCTSSTAGEAEMVFGDGTVERLAAGSFARVDADTVRKIRNTAEVDLVFVCVGGLDGYVGRDGRVPPGEEQRVHPIDPAGEPG